MDPSQVPLLQLHFQIMAPPVMQNSLCPGKSVPGSFKLLPHYPNQYCNARIQKHHQPILEPISKGQKPSLMFFYEPLVLVPVTQWMLKQVLYPANSGWQKLIYSILLLVR